MVAFSYCQYTKQYTKDHVLFQIRHKDVFIPEGIGKHSLVKNTNNFNPFSGIEQTDPTEQGLTATADLLHRVRQKFEWLASLLENKQLRR